MKDLKIDSESKKIETEIYREKLHELNLISNKKNFDLFFVPFSKSESQNVRSVFGQRAGKWILQPQSENDKTTNKEFASKRKAINFIKATLKGNFLICVRYKRDFERELADVPVQLYLHNLEEGFVKQIIFRYEWKYIFDTSASTKEYYEKFEKYILGEATDKETSSTPEKNAFENDLIAEKPKQINFAKITLYTGSLFLFADTIALLIYKIVKKIDSFNDYLIGFGVASIVVLSLLLLTQMIKFAKVIKANKEQKDLATPSEVEE